MLVSYPTDDVNNLQSEGWWGLSVAFVLLTGAAQQLLSFLRVFNQLLLIVCWCQELVTVTAES